MSRNKNTIFGLLVVMILFTCFLLCQGCWWEKPQEKPVLKQGPALVAPALLRKSRIDENKLKRQLEIIHPVLPPAKQSRYQFYITPNDAAVGALAGRINGAQEAYGEAVQWIWVSDQTLHGESEKWLMPREFLSDTPNYPGNPLKGNVVSDCEEQANTLVSLVRAEGVNPENVRVVLGKVKFGDEEGGHAWVELWHNGRWLALESTSGPYWDDDEGKLVTKGGAPFNYYGNHDYPVIQVWAYYNDIYYLDPRTSSGNAPDSWQP